MKRALIVIVIILVILIFGFYFFAPKEPKNVIKSYFPDYFPEEMIGDPYMVNLEVLPDSPTGDETHRVIASYISHTSEEENKISFKKYFEDNGFTVEEGDAGEQSFIGARKDKITSSVTFWKRSPIQVSIVYIISK
ncbi:MAG TPA: hypothetical protein VJH05_00025 [Candidatus Paceibacterota bacterium]